MRPTVSIVIPVFNAEITLPETLSSIKELSLGTERFHLEVIAVDDGSTDESVTILNRWTQQLPLRVVQLPHSGSPAEPRNRGIEIATGEYIFFLDADDVLLPGGLAATVDFAIKNESDVVLPRMKSLDGRGVPRGMFSENRDLVKLSNSRIYWALNPMKLVKRTLLIDNNIRFASDLDIGEDQPFSAQCYMTAKKISILSSPPVVGVRYTKSKSNMTLQPKPASAYFKLFDRMVSIFNESNLSDETKNFLWIRHWEIEIARELIWNTLPALGETDRNDLEHLHALAATHLVPNMLPRTSIRWRGIVGLIATANYCDLETLVNGRRLVLENKSLASMTIGVLVSNWIRLKATLHLPKSF